MSCKIIGGNPNTACNLQEGLRKKYFTPKKDFYFANEEDALNRTKWIEAIQNKDLIPLPSVIAREGADEGAVYEQTPYGSLVVRDGRMEEKILITSNSDLHKRLRTLKSAGEYSIIYAFDSGAIKMYRPKGTTELRPFSMQFINTEYQRPNDGSVGSKTPIHLSYRNPTEHEDDAVLLVPSWDPEDLEALKDVKLTVVSATSTKIVFTAMRDHINSAVSVENPVLGLDKADLTLLTGAGASQTITTLTYDATTKQYSINGTGLVSGTLDLKLPSLMTLKGYESTGAVAVTVV